MKENKKILKNFRFAVSDDEALKRVAASLNLSQSAAVRLLVRERDTLIRRIGQIKKVEHDDK